MRISEQLAQAFASLGLAATATQAETRQAYLDHIQIWNPDRFQGDARLSRKAEEMTKTINNAYSLLEAHFYSKEKPNREGHPNRLHAKSSPHESLENVDRSLGATFESNGSTSRTAIRLGIAFTSLIPAQLFAAWFVFSMLGFGVKARTMDYPNKFTLSDSFGRVVKDRRSVDEGKYYIHGKAGEDLGYIMMNHDKAFDRDAIVVSDRIAFDQYQILSKRDNADYEVQFRRGVVLWLLILSASLLAAWGVSANVLHWLPPFSGLIVSVLGWVSVVITMIVILCLVILTF